MAGELNGVIYFSYERITISCPLNSMVLFILFYDLPNGENGCDTP